MATVTLDTSTAPDIELWDTDDNPLSLLPRAKIVFRSDVTVALLGAGDVLVATGVFALPANFAYLALDFRAQLRFPALADASDFEDAIAYHFTVNAFETHHGVLVNQVLGSGATPVSIQARNPSITNDFITFYTPQVGDRIFREISGGIVLAETSTWTFQTVFVNPTGDTPAGTFNQEYTFLQYTVEQARRSGIHLASASF